MSKKLIAIGDLHGDLDASLRILLGMSLIDEHGNWIATNTHLVQVGDVIDRGKDSVNLMDYLIELEEQAKNIGSEITCLLGNHELMVSHQDFRYVRATEQLQFERFWYNDINGLDAIFRGSSPYAKWIRQRPAAWIVDKVLFVHAGVDAWALDYSIEQINHIVVRWISHLQGTGEDAPSDDTENVVNGERGLLWHNGFETDIDQRESIEMVSDDVITGILEHFNVELIVVGHRPTSSSNHEVVWPHPNYGNKVAVIDTGISEYYDGKLSANTFVKGELHAQYFERGDKELATTIEVRKACVERRNSWSE